MGRSENHDLYALWPSYFYRRMHLVYRSINMAILSPKKSSFRSDQGIATVEMAIITTVLLLLTFGGIEYGWMFYRMQEVSNVSREAVRTAVLPTSNATTVTNRVTVLMTAWNMETSGYTVTINPANLSTATAQTPITVTISVPYAAIGMTGIPLFPTPDNLTSSATMAREGP